MASDRMASQLYGGAAENAVSEIEGMHTLALVGRV